MPVIPTGYAQLNNILSLTGDNEEMICTMGIKFDEPAPITMQAVVNEAFTAFETEFKGLVSSTYTFKRTDMYVGATGGSMVFSSTSAPVFSTNSSVGAPQNCAYLLRKITATAGRTGRGRFFLPGVTEDAVDPAGNLLAARVTALSTAGNNYIGKLQTIVGVAEAYLLPSLVGDLPKPITTIVCDSKIATQRRRLR